jgi:hypothetical protein
MQILLALVATLGSVLAGTTLAEQRSPRPVVLAALGSTCSSGSAASTALEARRHDVRAVPMGTADVDRLHEYLSFHSDAVITARPVRWWSTTGIGSRREPGTLSAPGVTRADSQR